MKTLIFSFFLFFFWTKVSAIKPDRVYRNTPKDFNISYLESQIKTSDGYDLIAWCYTPTALKKNVTIIISNGDAGNMSYYLGYANLLAQIGYNVVTYDYRGFGHSSLFNANERSLYLDEYVDDLKAIINYSKLTFPKNKLCLWGLSMGTIISILAADSTISYIVGDSFVKDPIELCKFYKSKSKDLVLPESAKSYKAVLKKISIPILVFSGKQDQITTVLDASTIANNHPKSKIIIYDGKHLEAFRFFGINSISKFLYDFFKNE